MLEFTSGIVILMFNIVLISLSGEKAVAIFSIISNIGYVGKGIFNGMSQAAQPIIGESYGAGKYRNVVLANRYASVTALIFSLTVYALIQMCIRDSKNCPSLSQATLGVHEGTKEEAIDAGKDRLCKFCGG